MKFWIAHDGVALVHVSVFHAKCFFVLQSSIMSVHKLIQYLSNLLSTGVLYILVRIKLAPIDSTIKVGCVSFFVYFFYLEAQRISASVKIKIEIMC